MVEQAYVYILASTFKHLYIGVTTKLEKRIAEHQNGAYPESFTSRYKIDRLVYLESYSEITTAINREKQLKRWSRIKKIALIVAQNPTWQDLSKQWGQPIEPYKEPQTSSSRPKAKPKRRDPRISLLPYPTHPRFVISTEGEAEAERPPHFALALPHPPTLRHLDRRRSRSGETPAFRSCLTPPTHASSSRPKAKPKRRDPRISLLPYPAPKPCQPPKTSKSPLTITIQTNYKFQKYAHRFPPTC